MSLCMCVSHGYVFKVPFMRSYMFRYQLCLYHLQIISLLTCFYVFVCFRVVNQYHELVKSEAKCPVKMFHNSGGSINLSHLSPGKEMEVSLLS